MHPPPSFFPKRGRGTGKMRKKKQGSRGAVVMWEGRERVYTHILAAAAALASDGGAADLSSFLSFSFSFSFRGKSAQGRPSLSSPRGQKKEKSGGNGEERIGRIHPSFPKSAAKRRGTRCNERGKKEEGARNLGWRYHLARSSSHFALPSAKGPIAL